MIADKQAKLLLEPVGVTAAGVNGSWIDMIGFDMEHGVKALLMAGDGTTPGTCGGYIQASDSSTGASPATVLTFDGLTSAGGLEEKHFASIKRYVRFVGDVQTGRDMELAAALVAQARYTP